ncbi:MAG: O-antigen ligase family protein [Psychrilyobacter sp.]|uniref:O-antigen ligase family protein n=1 Tax=Psychrilyobacter sp. TaxID=2586924 RepID=UPI003C74EF64
MEKTKIKIKTKTIKLLSTLILIVVMLFPFLLIKNSGALKTLEHSLFIFIMLRILLTREVYINKNLKTILVLLAIMFGSIFINLKPTANDSLTIIRYMFAYFGLMIALTQIRLEKNSLKLLNYIFLSVSLLFLIFGWIEFYKMKFTITRRFSAGYDIFIYGYAVSFFILYHLQRYFKETNKMLEVVNGSIIFMYIPLLVANSTRMNWLVAVFLIFITIGLNFNKKKLILLLLIFTIGTILVPNKKEVMLNIKERLETITSSKNGSNNSRKEIYRNSIRIFKTSPMLGAGFRNYRNDSIKLNYSDKYKEYFDIKNKKIKKWPKDIKEREIFYAYFVRIHSHDNFLDMLRGTGIQGALAYILIFIIGFIELFKRWRHNNRNSFLETGLIMILFLQLVGLSETTLHMRRINEIVLFFVGIGLSKTFDKKEIIKEENNDDK